jgi:steroid delta-isomerase
MTDATETEIRRIYDGWHDAVVARDLAAVTALYAEDAIFETPLILAVQPELGEGILRGRPAISAFFDKGFATPANGPGVPLGRWYRTGVFFANGRQLTWEYPRATPEGDQIDLMEMMEIDGGLIRHHRVYWGWVGFKALAALGRRSA